MKIESRQLTPERSPRQVIEEQNSISQATAATLNIEDAYESFLNALPVKCPRKLLFINIPHVPSDLFLPEVAKQNGYYNYPPLGYLYLAAAARLALPEIELSILDLNHEILRACHRDTLEDVDGFWKDLIRREIEKGDQLHVCVGNNFAVLTPRFLEITEFIKDSFEDVTIVTGGVEITQNYKRVVEGDYCHIAFRHNAEFEFKSFLEACSGAETPVAPAGVAFKLSDTVYETEPGPGPTQFLDIRPYYPLLEIENYHENGGLNPFSRFMDADKVYGTVLTNRGCRANCTYCAVKAFYPNGVISRPIKGIIDEIRYLMEERGVRLLDILDDDPTYLNTRAVELFKAMAESLPPGLEWMSNNGITGCTITEEIMYWMVKSGCKAFKVGVESGNEHRLREIRKPATKDGLREAGKIFSKYPEVFVGGNYMLGFPGETFGEMLDTFEFANELAWDWAGYLICQPAIGTPMFDAFAELGDDRCNEDKFEGLIPARFANQGGTFGYYKGYHSEQGVANSILSGRDVFNLPLDQVPSSEQIKEIWFTFNLLTNFLYNRNWQPGGNPEKIVRWFEAIAASYPRDASMCAMLSYGNKLIGNQDKSASHRAKFQRLYQEYSYWQRRVEEFPELLEYAG